MAWPGSDTVSCKFCSCCCPRGQPSVEDLPPLFYTLISAGCAELNGQTGPLLLHLTGGSFCTEGLWSGAGLVMLPSGNGYRLNLCCAGSGLPCQKVFQIVLEVNVVGGGITCGFGCPIQGACSCRTGSVFMVGIGQWVYNPDNLLCDQIWCQKEVTVVISE